MTQDNLPQIVPQPGKEPLEMDERGLYRITSQAHELRVAKMLLETGAVPASFKTPSQVCMAIQALSSLNLNWRSALRQCGFDKHGNFLIYGDLELAIVRQSGQLERIEEFLYVVRDDGSYQRRCFDNGNLHVPASGAVCRIWRKGYSEPHEATFSVEDAKRAALWGKPGPWSQHSQRMLQLRARGMAVRNTFSDFTQGVATVEYDGENGNIHSAAPHAVERKSAADERLEAILEGST